MQNIYGKSHNGGTIVIQYLSTYKHEHLSFNFLRDFPTQQNEMK